METIEAQSKQKSDLKLVEELLKELAEETAKVKEAGKRMKDIELQLLEIAEKREDWFEDSKTKNFENGQLKWVANSRVEVPKDFDLKALQKKYPTLVNVKVTESIPIAKLRTFMEDPKMGKVINDMGIGIITEDKFKAVTN